MTDKQAGGLADGERPTAEDRELLNADGQSARLLSNKSGEYSIDNARAAFDEAFAGETEPQGKGGDDEAGGAGS